jgi:hypothetical protein
VAGAKRFRQHERPHKKRTEFSRRPPALSIQSCSEAAFVAGRELTRARCPAKGFRLQPLREVMHFDQHFSPSCRVAPENAQKTNGGVNPGRCGNLSRGDRQNQSNDASFQTTSAPGNAIIFGRFCRRNPGILIIGSKKEKEPPQRLFFVFQAGEPAARSASVSNERRTQSVHAFLVRPSATHPFIPKADRRCLPMTRTTDAGTSANDALARASTSMGYAIDAIASASQLTRPESSSLLGPTMDAIARVNESKTRTAELTRSLSSARHQYELRR